MNDFEDIFDRVNTVQDSIDNNADNNKDTIGDVDPDEAQTFNLKSLFGLKNDNDTPIITQESE